MLTCTTLVPRDCVLAWGDSVRIKSCFAIGDRGVSTLLGTRWAETRVPWTMASSQSYSRFLKHIFPAPTLLYFSGINSCSSFDLLFTCSSSASRFLFLPALSLAACTFLCFRFLFVKLQFCLSGPTTMPVPSKTGHKCVPQLCRGLSCFRIKMTPSYTFQRWV